MSKTFLNFVRYVQICDFPKILIQNHKDYEHKTYFNWGGNYVSPMVKPLEIESEGLLCGSGFDRADINYDPDNDLGEI